MIKPIVAACAAILCWAPAALAQQTPADVMSFLVTNQSVQTGDFQKDQAAAAATRDTITRALLVNLASVPIATSSSGFAYRLDPELGTMSRVSDSFGTFFVERAIDQRPRPRVVRRVGHDRRLRPARRPQPPRRHAGDDREQVPRRERAVRHRVADAEDPHQHADASSARTA